MPRRTIPGTVRAALQAISAPYRPLPFAITCPVCGSQIHTSFTGNQRIVYHFSCPSCPFWLSVDRQDLGAAIEYSAQHSEGAFDGRGQGWGSFDADTGEISLYCPPRRRAYLRGDAQ